MSRTESLSIFYFKFSPKMFKCAVGAGTIQIVPYTCRNLSPAKS